MARIVGYLALHGPTTRTRLAGALWPDVPDERAQGSLRTGLWRLQREHPGLVRAGATMVGLRSDLTIDYHEFIRVAHLLLLEPPDEPPDRPHGYAGSLRLLTADTDLLPGWDQEWLVHEQERFRQMRLHGLESLSACLCRQGVYGMALEAALAALRSDPLRESAHRAVIEVHLDEGNLHEARRQYLACLRMVRAELSLSPSAAMLELGRRCGATTPTAAKTTRRRRPAAGANHHPSRSPRHHRSIHER
jgi:DNA-binding SARP family transcriptional activator